MTTEQSIAVRERPILFRGEMVRAILAKRKTQTRRIVKFLPGCCHEMGQREDGTYWPDWTTDTYIGEQPCPYGQPGDRLWVRETFAPMIGGGYVFAADYTPERLKAKDGHGFWKPSIFMPRRASRITLEIVAVRCERVMDISREDVLAEGFATILNETWPWHQYMQLWESINGPGSWAANPWVWVIEFRRLTP